MKRIYLILGILFAMQTYAQQSTFMYFEDKNGLKDSLEIAIGLTDDQIEKIPSYTTEGAVQAIRDSTWWVVLKGRSWREERQYLRTYAYQPYNGLIEGERKEIYFPADRLPVTISWDKQFFINNGLTHSVMSDMGSWFDASCSVIEMYKVLLAANESCELSAIFDVDFCSFDYLGGLGELPVRHFGIALGTANNPIESVETIPSDTPSASKQLRDGHIFILRGDKTYTLTGQPYGDK